MRTGHAHDAGLAPALVTALQGRAHGLNAPNALKRVAAAAAAQAAQVTQMQQENTSAQGTPQEQNKRL
jgi:hypothetical protein